VIHFRCPLCGKTLKVAEGRAGRPVTCPQCKERSVVPAESHASEDGADAAASGPPRHGDSDDAPGLFSGMSTRVRWAAGVLAAGIPLGLLLAALAQFLPDGGIGKVSGHLAMTLAAISFLLLSVILYGQGTSCPSCRKWWARGEVSKEYLGRETFEKNGVPFAKSSYCSTYGSESCGHRWAVTGTEEMKSLPQKRTRPRLG